MTTVKPPRWERNKLLALLFVTCLTMPLIGAVAAAQPSAQHETPINSQVLHAAAAASAADRALVSNARALKTCQTKHPQHCNTTLRAVQSAGHRLAISEQSLAKVARRGGNRATSASAATQAPQLTVSGQTLHWTRPGIVHTFVFVRKVPGQADQYSVIRGTSTTPPPVPGYTVRYSVRTDVSGSAWAPERSIAYPTPVQPSTPPSSTPPSTTPPRTETTPSTPSINPQTAPIIIDSGQTLTWTQIGSVNTYVFVRKAPGQEDQYSTVSGTSITPAAVPGTTVQYSVRTAVAGSAWAPEVSITYPAAPKEERPAEEKKPSEEKPAPKEETSAEEKPSPEKETSPKEEKPASKEEPVSGQEELLQPPEPDSVIIGLDGASGWGPEVAKKALVAGFKSERIEAGGPYTTVQESYDNGFRDDTVIIGNTEDNKLLSTVNTASWVASTLVQVKEAVAVGYTLLEVGNEMNRKGPQQEPAKYAEMFMALSNAVNAAGIKGARLLFSGGGDYMRPNGTWSQITNGGGWVADAVKAQPGLLTAVGGFVEHPYGRAYEDNGEHAGPGGMEDQHANEVALGFKHTDVYITEYGVQYTPGSEGRYNAPSEALQAQWIKEAYTEFLSLPYVRGIWYYQLHNDSTGNWGLVSGTWESRPALAVLESFLHGST